MPQPVGDPDFDGIMQAYLEAWNRGEYHLVALDGRWGFLGDTVHEPGQVVAR